MQSDLSRSSSELLQLYFQSFAPAKRVVKSMDTRALLDCFDIPSEVRDSPLVTQSETPSDGVAPCGAGAGAGAGTGGLRVKLKEGLEENLLLETGENESVGFRRK